MSVNGDFIPQAIYLSDHVGRPAIYATKAAFNAAGWDITWRDANGVALASQPSWSLGAGDARGRHHVTFVLVDAPWSARVITPTALHISAPTEFRGEGFGYDADSLGGMIAASTGVTLVPTITTSTAEMFDGDSIDLTFSVPEAALTSIGAANLAAVTTLAAEIKLDSKDSSVAGDVTTLTETITSDILGTRTVRAILNAFPSVLAVPTANKSVSCTAHLRMTLGAKTIISSAISVTVKWKATT